MRIKLRSSMRRLCCSKYAVALPVTFLILFVSTLGIVSFTYYYSVERISAQGQTLKVSIAKENLISLDDAVRTILWQSGSSSTFVLSDCGGLINVQPTENMLTVSLADGVGLDALVFNASIGKITYQLPYSSSSQAGLYLKGDGRTIINQTGSSISQLCIQNGAEHPEIRLQYRPSVTYAVTGMENGKVVNTIRLYIVNLNVSDSIALQGELPLQILCVKTELDKSSYELAYEPSDLVVTCFLGGEVGFVRVPISASSEGAVINVETVVSSVCIQRWIR
ncbi:MAG: hypothetical protein NWE98_01285 [Candidatus Bathyarchaeota archaeon]|nr:hypothetical protein [Candidatus Bathyarchaeota archaeon]